MAPTSVVYKAGACCIKKNNHGVNTVKTKSFAGPETEGIKNRGLH